MQILLHHISQQISINQTFLLCGIAHSSPAYRPGKMVVIEIGVQCVNFLRTYGSLVLSHHLKVSRARVHDPTGTCSNISYFLIRLDLTLILRHFVPAL